MEVTLGKNLTAADVPPYSYTGIAHTFRMSPFNDYGYAMEKLREFVSSFDPEMETASGDRVYELRAGLRERAEEHKNFKFLHVTDAGFVDDTLDELFRLVAGEERNAARNFGPSDSELSSSSF